MISEARATARLWLQNFWERRARSRELAWQYENFKDNSPYVLADLARFCCANDSTHVQGDPELSQQNVGKRDVWLHIQQMAGLNDEDLAHLKEETERE